MVIDVPSEFAQLAREQVEAGLAASEEDAAITVLRADAFDVESVRQLLDPALDELDRGEIVDGDAFMRDLIEQTRAASAQ